MDTMTSFSDLRLAAPLEHAVRDAGYTTPTPIQAQAIPRLLEGRDLLGCARTGTGKTAAFALPILQRLAARPHDRARRHGVRALVLVPTRELAAQVADSFKTYGKGMHLSVAVIYGGVGQSPQVRALQHGVDILVATPGRLVDLMGQGHAKLGRVEVLVLDEADHMLDLGFIPDVRRIVAALPRQRQTMLFSATMPAPIAQLAEGLLTNPARVAVTPPATTVELVTQDVHFVANADKGALLARLLGVRDVERALVFTRTKRGADRVARRLAADGVPAEAIHGNKSQNARERTLRAFRDGRARVLVATDIAARGIDVDGISHVVNYELPHVPETYVHRIGRTARAGASGIAISLCCPEERTLLRDIEKLTRTPLRVAGGTDVAPPRAGRPSSHGNHRRQPPAAPAQRQRGRQWSHGPKLRGKVKSRPAAHAGARRHASASTRPAASAAQPARPFSLADDMAHVRQLERRNQAEAGSAH
jgi:ATP-dependent RNA helicase RhlE